MEVKCKNLKFAFKTGDEMKSKWSNSYGATARREDGKINIKLLNR